LFKLKKVELLGFKSFADRTRLEFGEGIAAIVGPNGCGKSNLSDAISWVLGEQSAKSLRGERMADVIFNGTSARPATSMAEVSLTLIDPESLNADGGSLEHTPQESLFPTSEALAASAPSESSGSNGTGEKKPVLRHRAGEITVTRRLFRSGESEYLINGENCRLRDIQDLFMGTGLGPESYAIIEQGRIGQILSSRPSDRRAIIEEAAGVSKFKTRKRLAEAKLESSRQNLSRITDILEEVTKQVNSLKRQASKARRWRETQEELRGRQRIVFASRLAALEDECERLREELALLHASCAQAGQQLEQLEREHKGVAAQFEEAESALTALRETLAQGEIERERLHARVEQAQQQRAALAARSGEALQESEEVNTQLAGIEQHAAERARQASELQQELAAARLAVERLLAQQEETGDRLREEEKLLEQRREGLLAVVSKLAELRNQLLQAEETGLALDRQAARAEAERNGLEQEYQRLTTDRNGFTSENEREKRELAALAQALEKSTTALEKGRAEESARRDETERLGQEFSAAQARKQALEESLAHHAYSTESVRRLLAGGIADNGHSFRPLGLLADFVEVMPGYEEVVEEFLKDELDCVVVERHDEALSGISLLRREGAGRSTFFVTHLSANGHADGNHDQELRGQPGVVAPVRDLVRFQPRLGLNGDLALPVLANAYVVENAGAAERLAGAYPHLHFLTPSGEHYHYHLVAGGKGKSAGPLALRREFRVLDHRTAELEAELRKAQASLAELAGSTAQLEQEVRRLTAAKVEAEKRAMVADEQLRQLCESCDRAAEGLRVRREEAAEIEREQQSNRARQLELRAQLTAATAERAEREAEIARASAAAREVRLQLDQLTRELGEAQAQAGILEERHLALEAERERLVAQAEGSRARLARLLEQQQRWQQEQEQLAGEAQALQAKLEALELQQQTARERQHQQEEAVRALHARREELVPRIEAARLELEKRREQRSEVEVAQARAESDCRHQGEQIRQELHADPAALRAELLPEQALAGEALATAEQQIQELKARLENLGPVNMMALEELQEAEERYAFLETQRQDLLASIEDTTQAIREIDQVSRQQFLEAFHAINAHFAESFRTLFGGGLGEMRLVDESDPDSGIDIAAQPPGKRLQNVLLLSGGEKALAALALLIALFRYTPSPFCILDEVDAPLDESNVDRFTRLIQAMSRHTQFVLITHNKRTMEITQMLYGVTMEEPGVSRLVSVRLDQAAPEPVAEAVLA
jgi:chromosome segregation protein